MENTQENAKQTQETVQREGRTNRYQENFAVSRQKGGRVSLFGSARPVRPIIVNMPEEEQ